MISGVVVVVVVVRLGAVVVAHLGFVVAKMRDFACFLLENLEF